MAGNKNKQQQQCYSTEIFLEDLEPFHLGESEFTSEENELLKYYNNSLPMITRGNEGDYFFEANLYSIPKHHFGSNTSSGSSTPNSIISYTTSSSSYGSNSSSSSSSPPSILSNSKQVFIPQYSPLPSTATTRGHKGLAEKKGLSISLPSNQPTKEVGLIGNFSTGTQGTNQVRGRMTTEEEIEIEGVSLRFKSLERRGFAF